MRIVQLSDIHVWRFEFNPFRLAGKRSVGMFELLTGRAKKFRLERLDEVIERVRALEPDHVLITGDLTTTALGAEFRAARVALEPLLRDPSRATVLPGNHDRYTAGSVRTRKFEETFGEFMPSPDFPWLRPLGDDLAILGLDPTRSHISATGRIPEPQLDKAKRLASESLSLYRRKIIACHYPLAAPPPYERQLALKRMKNAEEVAEWLRGIGPHLFCCGHVHAAWAFTPPAIPNQLCLNSGAPLLRDPTGFHLPGFLEIFLDDDGVKATHHAWAGTEWLKVPMIENPRFFATQEVPAAASPGL